MNSKTTSILITSLLAFALLTANVNVVGSVFATGGLDDEEEEEAIEELQNAVEEIQGTLGTIELNLTEGSNDIQANCPSIEEIVQEVVTNITTEPVENNNVTEPEPICPFVEPEVEQNVTEPEPPITVIPPVQNLTCPFVEPEVVVEENTTEVIEEIIENVTTGQPVCNIPVQEIIPEIILPPVEENVTEPTEQPICNLTGQPVEPEVPPVEQNNTVIPEPEPLIQDEQVVATIEFDASCSCFVVDKSPQEVQ